MDSGWCLPKADFLPIKRIKILVARGENTEMVRSIRLQYHPAGSVAPPGPAGNLGQQLKSAFTGSKIRKTQGKIRTDNADQGDVGEIMPFGNHLGAY